MVNVGNSDSGNLDGRPDPLTYMEGRLAEVAETLRQLEARVEVLEGRRTVEPVTAQSPTARLEPESAVAFTAEPEGEAASSALILGLVGRVFLVLAGAFFIRALTDAGKLPTWAGVLTGLAYAGTWALMADRAGKSGKAIAANVFSLTAAGIGFPLIWEATTKFAVFSPQVAALALLGMVGLLLAVAWRRALQAVAWVVILATLATGFALMVATAAIQSFTAAFLVLGPSVLWLTYGRRWAGLRWPTALAADASVLILGVLAAWPGGPPEAYRGLSIPLAFLQSLALLVLYLGCFALRTLQRNRAVILFEGIQAALVMLVGFGGAVRVAAAWGRGTVLLGVAALGVGAACYAVAFAFVERQAASSKNFLFYTSLALVFTLAGSPTLLSGASLAGCLALMGLLAGILGVRFSRGTLHVHATIYLAGAALASGYLTHGLAAFLGPPNQVQQGFSLLDLPMLVALGITHLVLARGWTDTKVSPSRRIPSLVLASLTVLGLGACITVALSHALPGSARDAGAIATLRTGVLSLSAILLAFLSRFFPVPEHRWLVYPILGVTALKLLLEDLSHGRPLTLFPALTLFGAALILAPRMLRGEAPGSQKDQAS